MENADSDFSVALVVPSVGRNEVLSELLQETLSDSDFRLNDCIVVVVPAGEPFPKSESPRVNFLFSERGSCRQRNAAIDFLVSTGKKFGAIAFLDDDVVLCAGFFGHLRAIHWKHPDVAGFTFRVIADGATKAPISRADATRILAEWQPMAEGTWRIPRKDPYGGFSMRGDLLGSLSFDERMGENAFMEDWDFYARLRAHGETCHSPNTALVHLAVKGGRVSERKRGYSQMMNPLYLADKGTLSLKDAVKHTLRVFFSNLRHMQHQNRRARLAGNLRAFSDFIKWGPCPERVTELP